VPKRSAAGTTPSWASLSAQASAQAGYFTTKDATDAGFSLPLLQHHLAAGRIERSQRGIFRLANYPPTEEEGLVPAWLWSRREGVFSHETALALHELSDALPAKLHLTVPSAWDARRIKIPSGLVLHYSDIVDGDREWRGPVQLTTPLRTIVDCTLAAVAPDLIEQAIRQGVRRGLFSRQVVKRAVHERMPARRSNGHT
jgi:predicted transcriptional regulator of viral defense system